jgi:gamma-glutamyl:cysteine ligase YbdK (ATP-grasp superfamily)
MGRDIQAIKISGEDRRRYRDKLRRSLDVFARMLREHRFEENPSLIGQEIELNLVDSGGQPSMRNAAVLDAIADPAWATEVGQFNLEINLPPRRLDGDALAALEGEVRGSLNTGDAKAREAGSRLVMIGILPTLRRDDLHRGTLSANERYRVLNDQIFAARGEDMQIWIDGPEQLLTHADSITPEAACTSVQLHVQVSPDAFASYWNASQAIAGVQVAVAANSPFLFGKQLWHETRITLFEQATDTRPDELKEQGVRPRVWFGERWITSVFDLFEENIRYFPALLPICEDEDPQAVLDRGASPQLAEMSLHNGTIYRWNRPVYAVADGQPHLRVENRVLPAGPSVADVMANTAFYYGLVRTLAEERRPVWTQMSFGAAAGNLHAAARHGIDAHLYWPGSGDTPAAELVLRRLLPLARDGLSRWGVSPGQADRLLGIIEQRCLTGQTGAAWQTATVAALERDGADRQEALRLMTQRYIDLMHTNEPVHTWPENPPRSLSARPRRPPRPAGRLRRKGVTVEGSSFMAIEGEARDAAIELPG